MRTLKDFNVSGKRVLLRTDFNAPVEEGHVKDDFRLSAYIPTIRYLQERRAKIIILSHLGRPQGQKNSEESLEPVARRLGELMESPVQFVGEVFGDDSRAAIANLKEGEVLLLENLRFHAEEEANDMAFAQRLAELGDCFVNDAFSASHRAHASIAGLPTLLPSAAGLLLEKEVNGLDRVRLHAVRPYVFIMGGAKASTKIPVVKKLLPQVDAICFGGVLANTILAAQGVTVGKSIFEEKVLEAAKEITVFDTKVHVPVDVVTSTDLTGNAPIRTTAIGEMRDDEIILDIGQDTVNLFLKVMLSANTVVWNGPVGLFEVPQFAQGTLALADAFKDLGAYTVVGGGDVIRALDIEGLLAKVNFVSTGGGAMLEYLAGEKLPGIEALK